MSAARDEAKPTAKETDPDREIGDKFGSRMVALARRAAPIDLDIDEPELPRDPPDFAED